MTTIDDIRAKMLEEAERRKLLPRARGRDTLREVIPTMKTLKEAGFSWEEIAEISAASGLICPKTGKPYTFGSLRSAYATLTREVAP